MSDVVTVELRLIEQIFRLSTTTEKKADLEKAAELLNDKFQEFRRNAPRVEHNKLVIMVALELMQEVLALNKSLQEYAHCERILSTILQEVEEIV
ncbi:cell division protein ZapA [Acinetobacter sp.]|uniref:cell division protein ZapA n=1 Tax=Acinetobacter sp. TaxID=472 RepID=UPI0031DFED1C